MVVGRRLRRQSAADVRSRLQGAAGQIDSIATTFDREVAITSWLRLGPGCREMVCGDVVVKR